MRTRLSPMRVTRLFGAAPGGTQDAEVIAVAHQLSQPLARGHFPNEQPTLKCLYRATRSLDPIGTGRARWSMKWKPALDAFAITFDGRINPSPAN